MKMKRRTFLKSLSAAGASAPLIGNADQDLASPQPSLSRPGQLPFPDFQSQGHRGPRTLLFLDYYPLMRCQNVKIRQSTATYLPEGRFVDPLLGSRTYDMVGSVPFWDPDQRLWRRFEGYPDLYAYESDDAIRWRIANVSGPEPFGGRKHPHHLYHSKVGGFGSSVLYHPEAADGYQFKMLVLEHIAPSYHYALNQPDSFWHPHALEARKQGGPKAFHWRKHSMLVSRDGQRWELRRDYDWGTDPMITEEHFTLFQNHHHDVYTAVHRPRWGDRRLFQSHARNCEVWTPMQQMLHPDVLDEGRIEFHGASVNRYDSYYLGLLWYGNYNSSDAPAWSGGPDSTHFFYSYDGAHFNRGHREPLIPLRQHGQPPLRGLWSRGILPMEDKVLLYSDTWEFDPAALERTVTSAFHDANEANNRRESAKPMRASIIHHLRKDGFTYLEPEGDWGQCQTLFFTLFDPMLTINADARIGELWYEIGLIGRNKVAPGFSYDDCLPMIHADDLAFPLRFREKSLSELMDQPIYVRFKFRRTRLYAVRGDFSFDFTHRYRLEKGMPLVEPSWLF